MPDHKSEGNSINEARDYLKAEAPRMINLLMVGEELSEQEYNRFNQISKVISTYHSVHPGRAIQYPVMGLLGFLAVILFVLLFMRVKSTEVELDLILTDVEFNVVNKRELFSSLLLSEFGVHKIQEARISRKKEVLTTDRIKFVRHPDSTGEDHAISLDLLVPAQTKVGFSKLPMERSYRTTLSGFHTIDATLIGSGEIRAPMEVSRNYFYPIPRAVSMRVDSEAVNLDLTLATQGIVSLAQELSVADLSFTKEVIYVDPEAPVSRIVSGTLGGAVYFEELNSKELVLRPSEYLRFDRIEGLIRLMEMQEDHIRLKFQGNVWGMRIGSLSNPRSLMPTFLQWLQAQQQWVLFWGTFMSVVATVLTILRYIGIK